MNKVITSDLDTFVSNFSLAKDLYRKVFLITGATGLIGSTLIRCLTALNKDIHVYAPVRNLEKAKNIFKEKPLGVEFIECDLTTFDYSKLNSIDYVIHCAAPTASKYFVDHAVETIDSIFTITKKLLDYAKDSKVKSFVYLSSLEVYGTILDDSKPITEDVQGYLNPLNIRSSYPMAKRAVENMCVAYAKEYNVPVKIARLTQTTGAGIAKNDNRIIAQFARLAANGEDIILHTTGESARPYCYTIDSITALLYILLRGLNGEAYNVANESTYISAKGMADFLKDNFNPNIQVKVVLDDSLGYAPPTKLKLSSQRLRSLGWKPMYDLKKIFDNLIAYLKAKD